MFILLSSKGKKLMNSYFFFFLKITCGKQNDTMLYSTTTENLCNNPPNPLWEHGLIPLSVLNITFQLHFAVHFPSSALTGNKDFGVYEKVVKTGLLDVYFAASSSLLAAKTVPGVQKRSRGYSLADVFPG